LDLCLVKRNQKHHGHYFEESLQFSCVCADCTVREYKHTMLV
jgi:hypothetical protein